ncbi:hypothetical protein FGG08_000626 [Glutinoglossum americanum]|uniref:Uncharacterized protein n=1 Tax=Glutinoglossum americanum TaxID=1670608 RepID=A0A9P8I9Z0_9PEZI|nr:hypothetical protein FGG08_000626 [Glutinoglossum americanum]
MIVELVGIRISAFLFLPLELVYDYRHQNGRAVRLHSGTDSKLITSIALESQD